MNLEESVQMQARFIERRRRTRLSDFPWWILAVGLLAAAVAVLISTDPDFNQAFVIIQAGLGVTVATSLAAFALALVLGLIAGLGLISANPVYRNAATIYVEIVRGIPMLVLIFFIALVMVPGAVGGINLLGELLISQGMTAAGTPLAGLDISQVDMNFRAVLALAVTYGAFLAEVFRAGIQSVPGGQMEAARAQGMTYRQAMRFVILPQAVRNILPALGNDFISMIKDSSLVSVLAVRDITQIARLYAGRSFKFEEAFTILAVMYLTITLVLSIVMKRFEQRMRRHEHA